ncbi:MAG: hypothetical protein Q7J29_02750 [Stagnimonas sp.]|nr:hypothetical protein [Stagnimonas sp.]
MKSAGLLAAAVLLVSCGAKQPEYAGVAGVFAKYGRDLGLAAAGFLTATPRGECERKQLPPSHPLVAATAVSVVYVCNQRIGADGVQRTQVRFLLEAQGLGVSGCATTLTQVIEGPLPVSDYRSGGFEEVVLLAPKWVIERGCT